MKNVTYRNSFIWHHKYLFSIYSVLRYWSHEAWLELPWSLFIIYRIFQEYNLPFRSTWAMLLKHWKVYTELNIIVGIDSLAISKKEKRFRISCQDSDPCDYVHLIVANINDKVHTYLFYICKIKVVAFEGFYDPLTCEWPYQIFFLFMKYSCMVRDSTEHFPELKKAHLYQ